MVKSRKPFSVLFVLLAAGTAVASPLLDRRSAQPVCMNENPPDSDLLGLGVRIGLYLQIIALILAVCCGQSDTLTAIPAAMMTALTLNIVLSMKASTRVFDANPVVQDFWVTQWQLFLLVTLLPYMFLFGRQNYRAFGAMKCAIMLLAIVYTYTQTFWFWTSGYKNSDELVCGVAETTLFNQYMLFVNHGRYAILIIYGVGLLILLAVLPNFIRERTGYLAPLIQKVSKRSGWGKALTLGLMCIPLVVVVIILIESSVRRGNQSQWVRITGQWLALGVGFFTAAEAIWHVLRNTYRELSGGMFDEDDHSLDGGDKIFIRPRQRESNDFASESLVHTLL